MWQERNDNTMHQFLTIKQESTAEITEKKSKFIAYIIPVESKKQAEEVISHIKKKYHDARHHCVAYRILEEETIIEKSSDDGEPSGTAGAPMMAILQKNELCNVVAIVIRYFGGILLGTGGLVRAYSEATVKAIEGAEKVAKILGIEMEVTMKYSEYETFKYYCQKNAICIENVTYGENILCRISLEETAKERLLTDFETKHINIENWKEFNKKYMEKSIIK